MNHRQRIFLSVLSHAAIEAAERHFFDIKGSDCAPCLEEETARFDCHFGGAPMLVSLQNWRNDEIRIAACLWPSAEAARWITCANAGRLAGGLFVSHYLTRNGLQCWLTVPAVSGYICQTRYVEALSLAGNFSGPAILGSRTLLAA